MRISKVIGDMDDRVTGVPDESGEQRCRMLMFSNPRSVDSCSPRRRGRYKGVILFDFLNRFLARKAMMNQSPCEPVVPLAVREM